MDISNYVIGLLSNDLASLKTMFSSVSDKFSSNFNYNNK